MKASADRSRRAPLPANVFWLGMVSFLTDFSSEMIFPLLPLFFTSVLGGDRALLGAMEGLVESVASLVKLLSGRLGDRLPRRKPLVLAGYGLASISRPLIALAAAPVHVVALRVLDRIGKGIRGAPRDALIADSVPADDRGRAFGFHRAMDHLGAIAGPLMALAIVPFLGGELGAAQYRILFGIAAVPAVLSVVCLALFVREVPRERPAAGAGQAAGRLGAPFWRLLAILGLFTLGNSSDAFLLLRARELGFSATGLYLVWALLHVVKAALSTPAGALSDRVPRRFLIAGGWLVYSLVYLGFGQARAEWHMWALFAVYGLYFGMVEGTERALVADLVPASLRSTAYGWYSGVLGIAALPASALFGLLWDRLGAPAAFGLGAGLALAASTLLMADPDLRRPAPPPVAPAPATGG